MTTKNWITNTLPDSDMTVLIRLGDEILFLWPGFHDGEQWCDAEGATLDVPVLGWMELEDAAAILDTARLIGDKS